MDIHILETEERRTSEGDFVAYEVSVDIGETCGIASIPRGQHLQWRRYSEFDLLRRFLAHMHPECIIPPLPEKTVNFKMAKMTGDKFDASFVLRRRIALMSFMNHVAQHPILQAVPAFHSFLVEDDWRKHLVIDVNGEMVAWTSGTLEERLMAMGPTLRPKNPDKRFSDLKVYADVLQERLSNAITTHTKMRKQSRELYSLYGHFATCYNEWGMSETAGAIGPAMLEHSKCLDQIESKSSATIFEEEMDVLDKLREYIAYCDSLREFIAKQEATLVEVERAVAAADAKENALKVLQNPDLEKGISGFLGRSQKLTPQEREDKVAATTTALQILREAQYQAESVANDFANKGVNEIAWFNEIKAKEIKECFVRYVRIQSQICQYSLGAWKRIKSSIYTQDTGLADAAETED